MKFFPCAILLVLAASQPARAGRESVLEASDVEALFSPGRIELQIAAGALFSADTVYLPQRPRLNDAGGRVRLGWMLSPVSGSGWWRGNSEFLVSSNGSGIIEGPGTFLAGLTILYRRNFVQPGAKFVPYLQVEGGGLINDVYQDPGQRTIGSQWEFELGTGLGVRWFVGSNWSLSLEFDYRHVSNAGLATRNQGLNSVGGYLGISHFF